MPKTHPALTILKGLVGATTLSRGLGIAQQGGVPDFEMLDDEQGVTAWIQGTEPEPYAVRVWQDDDGARPRGACTCPVGLGREFCKHQVALWTVWQTGLPTAASKAMLHEIEAAMADAVSASAPKKATKKAKLTPLDLLETRVAKADVADLRAWVIDLARESKPALQHLLALSTQTNSAEPLSADEVKTTVSGLLGRHRFLDYRESIRFADSLEPVLALYDRLLAGQQFELMLTTLAPAILRLDRQLSEADDSNGSIGSMLYALCQRWWLAAAGEVGALNLQKLAQQWLALYLEMGFPDGLTHCLNVPMEQVSVLQTQLIQSIASKITQMPVPQQHQYGWKGLQQSFALWLGDVDTWIALERSSEYCNPAGIMGVLQDAKRAREAINVGELSLRSKEKTDLRWRPDVRQILSQLYLADGFNDEAIEQVWLNFIASPVLYTYQYLQKMTEAIHGAGSADARSWTDKALKHLLLKCQTQPKAWAALQMASCTDYSAYFELILANAKDEQYQSAYDLLKDEGTCSRSQYQLIGTWRIKRDPLDGFTFTVKHCQALMSEHFVNRKHYESVYALLAKAAPYMSASEASKTAYLDCINALKVKYRVKTSFIPMLSEAARLV
jgi:hypothetical protein